MDKINVVNWFNPDDIEHLKAFRELNQTGMWPRGFIPEDVEVSGLWQVHIACILADRFIELQLQKQWVGEGGAAQRASDELLKRKLGSRSSEGKFGGAVIVRDDSGNEIGRRGPAY
jgi:hypothetical protein